MNEIAAFWVGLRAHPSARGLLRRLLQQTRRPSVVLNFGDLPTAIVMTIVIIVILVLYVAIVRNDIQKPRGEL
jgi:hypothetical protein